MMRAGSSEDRLPAGGRVGWENLASLSRKLLALRGDVLGSEDAEALHDIRVALARLRAVLLAFAPFVSLPAEVSEPRAAALAHAMGRLRDADIVTALLAPLSATAKGREADRLAEVLDGLREDQRAGRRRVRDALRRKRTVRMLRALSTWSDAAGLCGSAEPPLQEALQPQLARTQEELARHPGWSLPAAGQPLGESELPIDTDARVMHELRRMVKRARYQLEAIASPTDDPAVARRADQLHEAQDALGRIQDLVVTDRRLRESSDGYANGGMPLVTRYLRAAAREALGRWRELREVRQPGSPDPIP